MKQPLSLDHVAQALADAADISEFHISRMTTAKAERRLVGSKHWHGESQSSGLDATLFVDRKLGRGHSRWSPVRGVTLSTQIREASERALRSVGPSWRLSAPAAPAQVRVHDVDWNSPAKIIDSIVADFQEQLPKTLTVRDLQVDLRASTTRTILSTGFDNQYLSTSLSIRAIFGGSGDTPTTMRLQTRRATDLQLPRFFEEARLRTRNASHAVAVPRGEYDLVVLASSYLPVEAHDFGIWTPLVKQSSAQLVSSGLARYRPGQRITLEPPRGDVLSLRSDGARDYGLRSAPFAEHGEPVRRFSLVREGVAAGLALDHRAAGLTQRTANGGVRNLVMQPGSQSFKAITTPRDRDLLIVGSLSQVHSEARGQLALQIENAERHRADGSEAHGVRGGLAIGDIYQWLSDAHFCSEMDEYGWYQGPIAWRFNKVRVR